MKNSRVIASRIGLTIITLLFTACASKGDSTPQKSSLFGNSKTDAAKPLSDRDLRLKADQLYRRAHSEILDADYSTAIKDFDVLNERYPFSEYETQSEMEKIYAQYRSYQPDEALSGADRFLRAHPRSSQAEYVQYLKGVVNFSRDEAILDVLGFDNAAKDVGNARRSFGDFALLIQRYPTSKYCGDARRRMVYLRDRIARHELSIARYYVRRGAYVAASKRAEDIIAEYPGAPATEDALKLIESANRKLGLTVQADEAAKIVSFNADNKPYSEPTYLAGASPGNTPDVIRIPRATGNTGGTPANVLAAPIPSPQPSPSSAAADDSKPAQSTGFFSGIWSAIKAPFTARDSNKPPKTQIPDPTPPSPDQKPAQP